MRRKSFALCVIIWTIAFPWINSLASYFRIAREIPFHVFVIGVAVLYLLHCIHIIKEWNRRPFLFFGKYFQTAGPGFYYIDPLLFTALDDVSVQDVVTQVEAENIQTKDNVGVNISGQLTYRIDAERVKDAVVEVENIYESLDMRALSTLTDEAGKIDLSSFLEHRDKFCKTVKEALESRVSNWGVTLQAFELTSFQIADKEIAQAIAMKARAEKEGEAELARAKIQKKVAEALNEAAAVFDEQGRWLKGMEVLVELTRSANNNTILVPTDLTSVLAKLGVKS